MCISDLAIKEIHKLSDRFKLKLLQSGATLYYCGDRAITQPSPSNTVVFSNPAVVFISSLAPAKQISFNLSIVIAVILELYH